MAEVVKTPKKAMHPPYPRMICESMHALDKEMLGNEHHGHSLQSLKKYMAEHYKLGNGFEKHLNNTVKMMLKKKQLAHAAGHMGSFRLSKSMAMKEEKRLNRKPREMKAKEAPKMPKAKAAPMKKKAAKMEGPAKRAKKAAPKKMKA